jgi:hypothetical protein
VVVLPLVVATLTMSPGVNAAVVAVEFSAAGRRRTIHFIARR